MGWIFLPIMSLIFSSDLDTSASKWSPAAEEGKAVATVMISMISFDPGEDWRCQLEVRIIDPGCWMSLSLLLAWILHVGLHLICLLNPP